MKVRELMELLKLAPPEADVMLMVDMTEDGEAIMMAAGVGEVEHGDRCELPALKDREMAKHLEEHPELGAWDLYPEGADEFFVISP